MNRIALFAVALGVAGLSARPAVAADPPTRYAAVEIGNTGARLVVVEVKPGATKDAPPAGIDKLDAQDKLSNAGQVKKDTKELPAAGIEEVAGLVAGFVKVAAEKHKVPAANIKVAASSSVAKIANKDELAKAIEEETGKVLDPAVGLKVDYLTESQEVGLTIDGLGVLHKAPPGPLLDIGGGNTKGGLFDKDGKVIQPVSVPYGSKTYSTIVPKGAEPFAQRASGARAAVEKELKAQAEKAPDLVNAKKVYLTGGAAYAMTRVVKPAEAGKPFVGVTRKDVEDYQKLNATAVDKFPVIDVAGVTDPEVRKTAEADLKKIESEFGYEVRVAGSELLLTLFNVFLGQPGVDVQFVNNAHLAVAYAYALPDATRVALRKSLTPAPQQTPVVTPVPKPEDKPMPKPEEKPTPKPEEKPTTPVPVTGVAGGPGIPGVVIGSCLDAGPVVGSPTVVTGVPVYTVVGSPTVVTGEPVYTVVGTPAVVTGEPVYTVVGSPTTVCTTGPVVQTTTTGHGRFFQRFFRR